MGLRHGLPVGITFWAAVFGLAVAVLPMSPAVANPYGALIGTWSGTGVLTPLEGKPAKLSCQATYQSQGTTVVQTIRCAGLGHKFLASINLTYDDGKVVGSWTEAQHAASGAISGTANGGSVRARLSGEAFSGRMSIDVSGGEHTITVVQLDKASGAYRPVASVSLHR